MKRSAILANIAAALVASGFVLLRFCPPERFQFYPQCPIFHFFHIYCPGCGATRALAALTHAHFAEAFRYNELVVCLLPLLLFYFALAYRNAVRDQKFCWPRFSPFAAPALCAIALLFAVVRNVFWTGL